MVDLSSQSCPVELSLSSMTFKVSVNVRLNILITEEKLYTIKWDIFDSCCVFLSFGLEKIIKQKPK